MGDRLMNAEEVGQVLGLSTRSVLRGFEQGRFPGYRVSPRRVAFRLQEVLDSVRDDRSIRSRGGKGVTRG